MCNWWLKTTKQHIKNKAKVYMLRKVSNFIVRKIKRESKQGKISNRDISSIGKDKLYYYKSDVRK